MNNNNGGGGGAREKKANLSNNLNYIFVLLVLLPLRRN